MESITYVLYYVKWHGSRTYPGAPGCGNGGATHGPGALASRRQKRSSTALVVDPRPLRQHDGYSRQANRIARLHRDALPQQPAYHVIGAALTDSTGPPRHIYLTANRQGFPSECIAMQSRITNLMEYKP